MRNALSAQFATILTAAASFRRHRTSIVLRKCTHFVFAYFSCLLFIFHLYRAIIFVSDGDVALLSCYCVNAIMLNAQCFPTKYRRHSCGRVPSCGQQKTNNTNYKRETKCVWIVLFCLVFASSANRDQIYLSRFLPLEWRVHCACACERWMECIWQYNKRKKIWAWRAYRFSAELKSFHAEYIFTNNWHRQIVS